MQRTDGGVVHRRGCTRVARAERQSKHTFGEKMPYADLKNRRENLRRWKKPCRKKVLAKKQRDRAKHVNSENEKLAVWKKNSRKSQGPVKTKKEIPVNEPSRGVGRL